MLIYYSNYIGILLELKKHERANRMLIINITLKYQEGEGVKWQMEFVQSARH